MQITTARINRYGGHTNCIIQQIYAAVGCDVVAVGVRCGGGRGNGKTVDVIAVENFIHVVVAGVILVVGAGVEDTRILIAVMVTPIIAVDGNGIVVVVICLRAIYVIGCGGQKFGGGTAAATAAVTDNRCCANGTRRRLLKPTGETALERVNKILIER